LDGGRALSAWRRTRMLLLVVARWCRSRRRPGSARCSAEPARATPATGTRRWRAPGRPAASRPAPPPQGASRPAAATRRPPAHPSARPAPPRPPSSLPVLVSTPWMPRCRARSRRVSGLYHYIATFTVDITTKGTETVSYQWDPRQGRRQDHGPLIPGRPGGQGGHRGPRLRARHQPHRHVVESLHILNPPVVDLVLAPLTHTVCCPASRC
jgi:hypothetical protein